MLDTQATTEAEKANALPRLISRADLSSILGVSRATISRYESHESFPRRIVMPGGQVRFVLSEVKSYIETLRG